MCLFLDNILVRGVTKIIPAGVNAVFRAVGEYPLRPRKNRDAESFYQTFLHLPNPFSSATESELWKEREFENYEKILIKSLAF